MFCLCALVLCFPLFLAAEDINSSFDPWFYLETPEFRYVFQKTDEAYARKLLALQDKVRTTVGGFLGYLPEEQVSVLIRSNSDSVTYAGYFSTFPHRIILNSASRMEPFSLFVHEYTHYVQAHSPLGFFTLLSKIFGDDINFANLFLSLYTLEGTTSFVDGTRGNPLMQAMVKAFLYDEHFWSWKDGSWASWRFPGALRVYLNGYLLQEAVFNQFGPEAMAKVWAWKQSHVSDDENAFTQALGKAPDLILQDHLKYLRKLWASDLARPERPLVFEQTSRDQRQIYGAKALDQGDFITQESSLKETGRLVLHRVSGETLVIKESVSGVNSWDTDASGRLLVFAQSDPAASSLVSEASRSKIFWQLLDSEARVLDSAALEDRPWPHLETQADAANWPRPELSGPALENRDAGGRTAYALKDCNLVALTISPDGKRLFALRRSSDRQFLGEIDPERAVFFQYDALPDCNEAAFSRDGSALALSVRIDAQDDLACLDLKENRFLLLSRDEAKDYGPIFSPDGKLLFSSDRENKVAVYSWGKDGFSSYLEDPLMAYKPIFLESGEPRILYQSLSSEGYTLRYLSPKDLQIQARPDFLMLHPEWRQLWEARLKTYQELFSQQNPQALVPTKVNRSSEANEVKIFTDIALPRIWFPYAQYDDRGFGFGAEIQAASFLEENSWTLSALYYPDYAQADFAFSLALNKPYWTASIGSGYSWDIQYDSEGNFASYAYTLSNSFNNSVPLILERSLKGVHELSLGLSASYILSWTSDAALSLDEVFSRDPEGYFLPKLSLTWNWSSYSPQISFFGSDQFLGTLALLSKTTTDSTAWYAQARLAGALDLGGGNLLAVNLQSAASLYGNAWDALSSAYSTWNYDEIAPLGFRFQMGLRLPLPLYEAGLKYLFSDSAGFSLDAASRFSWTEASGFEWAQDLELIASLKCKLVYLYSSFPLKLGLGYRFDLGSEASLSFDSKRLALYFSVAGLDLLD